MPFLKINYEYCSFEQKLNKEGFTTAKSRANLRSEFQTSEAKDKYIMNYRMSCAIHNG